MDPICPCPTCVFYNQAGELIGLPPKKSPNCQMADNTPLGPPAPLRCACFNCYSFSKNREAYGLPPATSPFCTSGQCNCFWCEKALISTDIIGRQIYFSRCLRKKRVYNLRRSARKPAGFYKGM
jgi:hypothetical protein